MNFFNKVKNFFINLFLNKKNDECTDGAYYKLLELNKPLSFKPTKKKVATQAEFNTVVKDAEFILNQDFERLGLEFEIIPPAYKNRLGGVIGSMTIVADNDGKIDIKFHKRDDDGLWDGVSETFPEKHTTGLFKHEILFIIEEKD